MQTLSIGDNLHEMSNLFSRKHKEFSYFSQKTGFGISWKLSMLETVCMKYQNLFSRKHKKNIINLLSAELAQRAIKVRVKIR